MKLRLMHYPPSLAIALGNFQKWWRICSTRCASNYAPKERVYRRSIGKVDRLFCAILPPKIAMDNDCLTWVPASAAGRMLIGVPLGKMRIGRKGCWMCWRDWVETKEGFHKLDPTLLTSSH